METNVPEKDVAELDAKHLEEELNKSVGVAVDYKTVTRNNLFKFLIFSAIGVWVFFIPTTIGGNSGVPMVLLIGKGAVGTHRYELDGPDFVYRAFDHLYHFPHSKGRSHPQVP